MEPAAEEQRGGPGAGLGGSAGSLAGGGLLVNLTFSPCGMHGWPAATAWAQSLSRSVFGSSKEGSLKSGTTDALLIPTLPGPYETVRSECISVKSPFSSPSIVVTHFRLPQPHLTAEAPPSVISAC